MTQDHAIPQDQRNPGKPGNQQPPLPGGTVDLLCWLWCPALQKLLGIRGPPASHMRRNPRGASSVSSPATMPARGLWPLPGRSRTRSRPGWSAL